MTFNTNTNRAVKRGDIVIYYQHPGTGELFVANSNPAIVLANKGLSTSGVQLVDLHIFLPVLPTPTNTDYDDTTEIPINCAVRTDVPLYEGNANDAQSSYWRYD